MHNQILQSLITNRQQVLKDSLYRKTQVSLTYTSNRIEECKLTKDQICYIF